MIEELLSPKKIIVREESTKIDDPRTLSIEMTNEGANKSLVHSIHSMNPISKHSLRVQIIFLFLAGIRPPSTPERANHDFAFDIERLLKANEILPK